MHKKAFALIFTMAFVAMPLATHAGFFDMFRIDFGQNAQVRTAVAAYKKGDKAEVILQVQQALSAQKMYEGDLSGLIGPKTEVAIKAWQKSHGLTVTGMLDAETIASILGRGSEPVGGNRDGLECAGSAPQIMVTSPNGGESYEVGAQIEVTWETCNIPASAPIYITMGASANGQGHTFLTTGGTGTPNDGSEMFTLPESYTAGTYYVSVFRSAPNYLRDFSDASFAIEEELVCAPGSEPWVKVLSPNGGETYTNGQQVNVTWDTCNVPDGSPITIHLIYLNPTGDGSSSHNVLPGPTHTTNDDGVQNVTFNTTPERYGQNFKVGVNAGYASDPNGNYWGDKSDSKFSIGDELSGGEDSTTICNAQLLYPHPGQSYNLEENSSGTGYSVRVHVFLYINQNLNNNGCTWDTSGITFPIEGNNPPGGSAGLISLDGGTNGYPLWIHGDHMYHQSIDFNPNNPNTPAGPYNLTVLDGEGHEIVVPINISY